MTDAPLVSIITPSFNRADLIGETFASIQRQTYPHWEHLVIDDGSTDDTRAVAQQHAQEDERIRLMQRDRAPKGACTCRNIGVERAEGVYVLFLDTDDLLAPYCLEQRVAHMQQHPDQDFAVFPMLLFHHAPSDASQLWNVDTPTPDLLRVLHMDPVCQGTGTLWKTDAFRAIGAWDERLAIWQDIELHLRAFSGDLRYGKRFDLPPDVYIRKHEGSLSRSGYFSPAKLQSRAEVVKRAALLVQASSAAQPRDVRFIAAGTALGAAKALELGIVRDLCQWARQHEVLTRSDVQIFYLAAFLYAARLTKLSWVRSQLQALTRRFRPDNTLGTVALEQTDLPRPAETIERAAS